MYYVLAIFIFVRHKLILTLYINSIVFYPLGSVSTRQRRNLQIETEQQGDIIYLRLKFPKKQNRTKLTYKQSNQPKTNNVCTCICRLKESLY